jgi:hypothetical protein
VVEAVAAWQPLAGTVTLRYWDRPDGVLIVTDTRPGAETFQHRLTGIERAVYLFCDTGRTLREIVGHVTATLGADRADESVVGKMLDVWISARLMVHLDGRYLSLALRAASAVEQPAG